MRGYPKDWETKVRPRILRRDKYTCSICHKVYGERYKSYLRVHHITPLSRGGVNADRNLQVVCYL